VSSCIAEPRDGRVAGANVSSTFRVMNGFLLQAPTLDISTAYRSLQAMGVAFLAALPRLIAALVIIGASLFIARLARLGVRRAVRERTAHRNLQLAVGRLAYVLAVALCVLLAATVAFPSFTIGSLIQLLGVSGVVVGFAFKDIFQNFLAGILILVTNPFNIGDQIVVDAFEGTVEEIQTRATLIRTYDQRRIVVPNSDLFTKSVTVNTAFPSRRVRYDLAVKADTDLDKARQIATDVLTRGNIEGVEKDPVAAVLLLALSGQSMTLRLLWWSRSEHGEFLMVQDRVLRAIRDAFAKGGVALA
jgi:small-conductance mechanosensitive channel